MADPERKVSVDGKEFVVPADMSDEEAATRYRELSAALEAGRALLETTDMAAMLRAIADDMAGGANPWPADVVASLRGVADANEVEALERLMGNARTEEERRAVLEQFVAKHQQKPDDPVTD